MQGPFSLFQNLELGIVSIVDKCHYVVSWECVCKGLSEYSKRFMSYGHFSLSRDKQLHKLSQGDHSAHSENKPVASLLVDCSGSCNNRTLSEYNKRFMRYGHVSLTV